MTKYYYDAKLAGFYDTENHPTYITSSDSIEVTPEFRLELLKGESEGGTIYVDGGFVNVKPFVAVSDETLLAQKEREWRDSELSRCDNEINKIQDADKNQIGTEKVWRDYRKLLREWPSHKKFPSVGSRPAVVLT